MKKNVLRRRKHSVYKILKSIKKRPLVIVDLDAIPIDLDVPKFLEMVQNYPTKLLPSKHK